MSTIQQSCSLLAIVTLLIFSNLVHSEPQNNQASVIAIDRVWSGHPIKPHLLTRGKHQFVAYFDVNRQMTVAQRQLGNPWRYYKVDSWLGWDSHNYVTMELDSQGYLHVMGNMHADKLEYFRMTTPYDVRTLKRIDTLVDPKQEQRMTYPVFMTNKKNQLLVKYRDGGSGNGSEIYNIYDTKTSSWSRLHANQFLDGEGKMNAYFEGPTKGPDGMFHLIWVWRNTPDAATNHSLSYARSPDLMHWEDSNGKILPLPLTLKRTEIVAPVPPKGGMINGNVKLGFDSKQRPIIVYHKYDENGDTQIYVARKEKSEWRSVKISDWKGFRWDFGGGGSLGKFPVKPYNPKTLDDGTLGIVVRRHRDVMRFVLDPVSLKTLRVEEAELYPSEIDARTRSSNPELSSNDQLALQVSNGSDRNNPAGKTYYLSWLSQISNRDRAHATIPKPSVLLLHEF